VNLSSLLSEGRNPCPFIFGHGYAPPKKSM
jgi:hypothetical protein